MGDAFKDLDVSRAIYLVLYLLIVIMGMRGLPVRVRRRAPPPRCKACHTLLAPDAAPQGPWGGWTCGSCGGPVEPAEEPAPRTSLRGWMDQYPWAVYGAVWGLLIWGLLAGRDLWLRQPMPELVTLPLTVVGGLGVGWLATFLHARRG